MNPTDAGWEFLQQQLSSNMVSGETSVVPEKRKPRRVTLAQQIRNGTLKTKKNDKR
jgi:hypothetical protein